MGTCNFFDESFPPVGSVVNSVSERGVTIVVVSGVIGGANDLAGLDTTGSTHDGVVVCEDVV